MKNHPWLSVGRSLYCSWTTRCFFSLLNGSNPETVCTVHQKTRPPPHRLLHDRKCLKFQGESVSLFRRKLLLKGISVDFLLFCSNFLLGYTSKVSWGSVKSWIQINGHFVWVKWWLNEWTVFNSVEQRLVKNRVVSFLVSEVSVIKTQCDKWKIQVQRCKLT